MSMTPESPKRDAWFARRFPVGDARNGMSPVNTKGYLVVTAFVALIVMGGVSFITLALVGWMIAGVMLFAGLAIFGAALFIFLAYAKGDQSRTVADYRNQHAGD